MTAFVVNQINGKWIIGDNTTETMNGLSNWSTLGPILNIPSIIDGHNIEEIGYHAFFKCTKIEEINIENGIKQINERGFSFLTNLKSIVIPPSVEFIGYCGIHCYNETAQSIYGANSRKATAQGTLVVTFLSGSKIAFIGNSGISRKENIIIYFLGKSKPQFLTNPLVLNLITSVKVYSPFVKQFLGVKTHNFKCTLPPQKRSNRPNLLLSMIILLIIS